jgi:uncharacterized membrane protein
MTPRETTYGNADLHRPAAPTAAAPARIPALDIARTGALVAMVLFHFVFDLELFGYLPQGTTTMPGAWRSLAIATAGSFLLLAGAGLWLAHGEGIRWPAFWRRFAIIGAAAALVSVGTYMAFPDAFVFFGILHSIALCSLLGLAVLRLPVVVIAALVVLVFFAPDFARSDAFNAPWFWWSGLQTVALRTMDYEPVFPWFAPFLAGIALAKVADRSGLLARLATDAPGRAARLAGLPGRYSLIIYLVHQPILIGLVWSVTQILR